MKGFVPPPAPEGHAPGASSAAASPVAAGVVGGAGAAGSVGAVSGAGAAGSVGAVSGAGAAGSVGAVSGAGASDPADTACGAGAGASGTACGAGASGASGSSGGAGTPGAAAAESPDQVIAALAPAVAAVAALGEVDTTRLSQAQLMTGLDRLDAIAAHRDVGIIRLLSELIDRGEVSGGIHRLTDWLATVSPSLPRSQALDLVRLAMATSGPDRVAHEPILTAALTQQVSARRAAMLLRALARVRPALNDDTYTGDVELVLDAARRKTVFTEVDLARILDRLVSSAMEPKDHLQRDAASRAVRGVAESSLADGSVIRFIINADTDGAAALRAVLTSSLAAPSPSATGERDTRSASARRYDALIAVVRRGMAEQQGPPSGPSAQILVTTSLDALVAATSRARSTCADDTSAGGGVFSSGDLFSGDFSAGHSSTGVQLSPGSIRRLACDADIIPAVLGSSSEILDLGRSRRLASLGQRRALWHRDERCTMTGCTIPAAWCDAHHILHWAHGGRSDLDNFALLCPRHHTEVHLHGLTARVEPNAPPGTAVRWQVAQPPVPIRSGNSP